MGGKGETRVSIVLNWRIYTFSLQYSSCEKVYLRGNEIMRMRDSKTMHSWTINSVVLDLTSCSDRDSSPNFMVGIANFNRQKADRGKQRTWSRNWTWNQHDWSAKLRLNQTSNNVNARLFSQLCSRNAGFYELELPDRCQHMLSRQC